MPYKEEWVPIPGSTERQTTISAPPFRVDVPPGLYEIEIERGKEYLPLRTSVRLGKEPVERTFSLQRWIDVAARGWFSGETHVHCRIGELTDPVGAFVVSPEGGSLRPWQSSKRH